MRLKISARKSDLARLQAYMVGEALQQHYPYLEVEYLFRESLGDKNLNDPLWKMPEKGVFTQDFHADLLSGATDMVVHSWKDLPTKMPGKTVIAATLERADQRDILLVPKTVKNNPPKTWKLLSSSPRRAYNLAGFLKKALPFAISSIEFVPVRGNVPTRMGKLFSEGAQGLIVAKAALDRFLSYYNPEFLDVKAKVRDYLNQCEWMVLPLSENPTAAAQGALAVEVLEERNDLRTLLKTINNESYRNVIAERDILAHFGGGCHQKIGVSIVNHRLGVVAFVKGETDDGRILDQKKFSPLGAPMFPKPKFIGQLFPLASEKKEFFERESITSDVSLDNHGAFVTKYDAVQDYLEQLPKASCLWTSGTTTWFKLAKQGLWVHGTNDSLGESMPDLHALSDGIIFWKKMGHDEAPGHQMENLATYRLNWKNNIPDLSTKTHFFWSSGSLFLKALEKYPQIRDGYHATGLGNTYDIVRNTLGETAKIRPYLDYESWLKSLSPEDL